MSLRVMALTEDVSIGAIIMGLTSIGIAIGLNLYWRRKDRNEKKRNESIFAEKIMTNINMMGAYFSAVERETKIDEDTEVTTDHIMNSLKTFYIRNEQEMKDILYQTKLYLPFWSSLSPDNRKEINSVLSMFTWLLYEYYQPRLPSSMRKNVLFAARKSFMDKKKAVMATVENLGTVAPKEQLGS